MTTDKICLIMADSALVPDDGRTAGSRTTPSTIPAVRQGTAAARRLLAKLAGEQWQVAPDTLEVQNGTIANPATRQTLSYADLAKSKDVAAAFEQAVSPDVTVTPVAEWKVLGTPVARPNSRDLVTGRTSIRPILPAPACCMAESCVRPHMERRSNLSTSPKHKP